MDTTTDSTTTQPDDSTVQPTQHVNTKRQRRKGIENPRVIGIRVTEQEYQKARLIAFKREISISEYLRPLIMEQIDRDVEVA